MQHFLSMMDITPDAVHFLIERGKYFKANPAGHALQGTSIVMLFEKPSLRTHVSFHIGIRSLGGDPLFLHGSDVGLGVREVEVDVARTLSLWSHGIVARVNKHETLDALVAGANVPVVNALSDKEHPCEALGDLITISERRPLLGSRVVFVGDGNNVASSLALAMALTGANFVHSAPPGYELREEVVTASKAIGGETGGTIELIRNPIEAVAGANVIYTDVWTSMNQDGQQTARKKAFQSYTVSPSLMRLAASDAVFMHPLPARMGEEISEGMLQHTSSIVFEQAENRLFAVMAVLEMLCAPSTNC